MNESKGNDLILKEQELTIALEKIKKRKVFLEFNTLSEKEKVVYGIKLIKKGKFDDIIQSLLLFDSKYNLPEVKQMVNKITEQLFEEGKVGLVKIEKEYGYYFLTP